MFSKIKQDIHIVFERDPAARSVLEIIFCYPGFHALCIYRIAHWFWRQELYFLGRFISHLGRFVTGIEIHPGATIGSRFFIDHGMGVVIGETAEIGNGVTLYHGVTLGGTTWKKIKRHPTLGNNVVVGAGAKILGDIKIGDNSLVGSGSVVVKDVPPNSTVVGVPGRVVFKDGKHMEDFQGLNLGELPNPVAQVVKCILDRIYEMEKEVKRLKGPASGEVGQPSQECKVILSEPDREQGQMVLDHFIDGAGI